jgi:hypothetical protein
VEKEVAAALKVDPVRIRTKRLIWLHDLARVRVPIGAVWDPTKTVISLSISNT